EGIERDGDCLSGRISGRQSREWRAEIHDERENESFAWRSTAGADCAGLITFHELSDRLTRIEADLDVLPTTPKDAMALAVGIALLTVDARIVIASVDTYLRFAEAVNRLDLSEQGGEGLPEIMENMTEGGAENKTKGVLQGAKETLFGSGDDEDSDDDKEKE